VFCARLGHTGDRVESQTVFAHATIGGYQPALTFDPRTAAFLLVHATNGPTAPPLNFPLYGYQFTRGAAANVLYGTECGGTISARRLPHAGDEFYAVGLSRGTPNRLAALLVGAAPGAQRLDFVGMGTCVLNVDLRLPVIVLNTTVDATGTATLPIALPDSPVVLGDVYFQWVFEAAAPWSLPLRATQGLRAEIR
jgi:hypothetical protein